mgnify:CR=1 FL=1
MKYYTTKFIKVIQSLYGLIWRILDGRVDKTIEGQHVYLMVAMHQSLLYHKANNYYKLYPHTHKSSVSLYITLVNFGLVVIARALDNA